MAHRSGGGSHSGGHHSGGHHSSGHGGSGGGNSPRYSHRPFPHARRFRYYDRHGRERYLYGSQMPTKPSLFSLIFPLIFFIPFILAGIFSVVSAILTFTPTKPLRPDYEPTDVHIMDGAGVIDDEDSLEEILQEFEDTTGISPCVMTVYDEEWKKYYNELWIYAYEIYINSFSDEQHFLIVYSEPENAEELDFVDWSWEGIQGDDTDSILTESKVDRFGNDLQDNLYRKNVSVGEAFEKAFKKSLTYMMENENNSDTVATLLFAVVWNVIIFFAVGGVIRSYIISNRDYQEVPIGGSANTVPGAMGGNNTAYQNGTTFQSGTGVPYQNQTTFQGDANYQGSQIYQSGMGTVKKYMYYDKNGNKKYDSVPYSYAKSSALAIMILVLIIAVPMLFFSAFLLFGLILMVSTASDVEVASGIIPMLSGVAIWNMAVIAGIVLAIRHYKNVKNRQYFEVSNDNSVNYGNSMPNNNAAQYSTGAQYNAGMQYNGTQYNTGMQNNWAQYNAAGAADSDFYNDEARFRGPEYYDDDARYHGSTAYEAGKK